MLEKVIEMIAEHTEVPYEEITSESRLIGDLALSSLDLVDIIVRVEDEYGVMINERQIESLQTVGDVAAALEELINAK